jgi:plasmid stabilization system protein ParE
VDDAAAFVAEDSPLAAQRLVEGALEAAASLTTLAQRGRAVPEVDDPAVRELLVGSYRLLYVVDESRVTIVGFLHGARDFAAWRRGED